MRKISLHNDKGADLFLDTLDTWISKLNCM